MQKTKKRCLEIFWRNTPWLWITLPRKTNAFTAICVWENTPGSCWKITTSTTMRSAPISAARCCAGSSAIQIRTDSSCFWKKSWKNTIKAFSVIEKISHILHVGDFYANMSLQFSRCMV